MSKLYRDLLKHLDEGQSLALETVVRGRQGEMAQGMTRRFVPVRPITDLKGRRCATVATTFFCSSASLP